MAPRTSPVRNLALSALGGPLLVLAAAAAAKAIGWDDARGFVVGALASMGFLAVACWANLADPRWRRPSWAGALVGAVGALLTLAALLALVLPQLPKECPGTHAVCVASSDFALGATLAALPFTVLQAGVCAWAGLRAGRKAAVTAPALKSQRQA